VPVTAGFLGILSDLDLVGPVQAMTHLGYLSGLLLGIGLAYYALIPDIVRRGGAFGLLTLLVVTGGLARLTVAVRLHAWGLGVVLPLAMELGVTPALWLWQRRIARRG
jgi:hypothetical protein